MRGDADLATENLTVRCGGNGSARRWSSRSAMSRWHRMACFGMWVYLSGWARGQAGARSGQDR